MSENLNRKTTSKSKGVSFSVKGIIIFCSIIFMTVVAFFMGKYMSYDGSYNSELPIEGGENYEFNISQGNQTLQQDTNSGMNHNLNSTNGNSQNQLSANKSQNHGVSTINNSPHKSEPVQLVNSSNETYAPTKEYLRFFNTVNEDYMRTRVMWQKIKNRGYRTKENDRTIYHYMDNIESNLRARRKDKKNYNALSIGQKSQIEEFSRLADEIEREYNSLPMQPLHNPE